MSPLGVKGATGGSCKGILSCISRPPAERVGVRTRAESSDDEIDAVGACAKTSKAAVEGLTFNVQESPTAYHNRGKNSSVPIPGE